jgi:hypothetical protein
MILLRHLPAAPRRHLPESLDPQRPGAILEHARLLLEEDVSTPASLTSWLAHRAEFEAAVEEGLLVARLEVAEQPSDPLRRAWLEHLHQDLGAALEEMRHRLDEKVWQAPARHHLKPDDRQWERALEARLSLYREHNLALLDRLRELEHAYLHLCGRLVFPRCGQDCSPAEARHLLAGSDGVIRRAVWEARAAHLESLRADFEDMMDEVLALREQVARNADQPTWNHFRLARGETFPQRPWDMASGAVDGHGEPWDIAPLAEPIPPLFGDGPDSLDELADALSYHAPRLALMLRHLLVHGLLERPHKAPLVDVDACFWLPAHGLPLLRLDLVNLDDRLEHLLALVARGRHHMAAQMGQGRGCLPGLVLWPRAEDLQLARGAVAALLADVGRVAALAFTQRQEVLRKGEQAECLVRELWTNWAHQEPGAGREERRRRWLDLQVRLHPGLAQGAHQENLADTLFLHGDFFLPDWAPPSRMEGISAPMDELG